MRQKDWPVDDIRHFALCSFSDVVTEGVRLPFFIGDLVFLQSGDGVRVSHAHERTLGDLEFGVEVVDFFFVFGSARAISMTLDMTSSK